MSRLNKWEWGIAIAIIIMVMFMCTHCGHIQVAQEETWSSAVKRLVLESGKTQEWHVEDIVSKRLDLFHQWENGDWVFIMVSVIEEPQKGLDIIYIAHWKGADQLGHYWDAGFDDVCDYAALTYDGEDQKLTKKEFQELFIASVKDAGVFIESGWFEIDLDQELDITGEEILDIDL